MNRILILGGGSILIGILAGFVTRSIWVGIGLPVLLIAFLVMMYAVKDAKPDVEDEKREKDDDGSHMG